MRWLRSVGLDVRFGCRLLARQPGFTLAAVLVAALGIGAMTAVFGLIDAAMLRRLPYPHADRLVWISAVNRRRGLTGGMVTLAEAEHWQRAARNAVQAVAFGGEMNSTQVDAGTRRLARATVRGASDNTFQMLGARPLMGRLLGPGDTISDAVISYRFWQREFQGAASVVGRSVDAPEYGTPWTVVGVLPPGLVFGGGRQTDIWTATTTEAQFRDVRYRWAIALLRPGVTARQAAAALSLADRQLASVDPAERGWSAEVEPLRRHFFGHLNYYFLLLFGAAGLALLLACGNLAALLLARAGGRQRELAVRAALGAGRARLARQLLAETR
jgi:putative ABC transport system permease protein